MSAAAAFADEIAGVEPSFRVEAPWEGRFEIAGRSARCVRESDQLRLSLPVQGLPLELVRRQSAVRAPVKVATGPLLVAEVPVVPDLASSFRTLRVMLGRALGYLETESEGDACAGDRAEHVPREGEARAALCLPLQSAVEASVYAWTPGNGHSWTVVGDAKVVADSDSESAVVRTDVLPSMPDSAVCLTALAHYVLAINERLHFIRGAFAGDCLVLESFVPANRLTVTSIEHAVGAVTDSLASVKRPCRALLVERVANEYLRFHRAGEPP
jgi:hypothetical protein